MKRVRNASCSRTGAIMGVVGFETIYKTKTKMEEINPAVNAQFARATVRGATNQVNA